MKKINILLIFYILLTSFKIIKKNNIDYDNYLILVNKNNKIKSDYYPNDLVLIDLPKARDIYIRKIVLDNYTNLYNDALLIGYKFIAFSGFRDIDYQKDIYLNSYDKYVAYPGYSEHHTGLALDISISNVGLSTYFEGYEEYNWLSNNSYKYGFILRYPKDKTDITLYPFEPWHYRYVGIKHSTYIYENNLTLEEYLEIIN